MGKPWHRVKVEFRRRGIETVGQVAAAEKKRTVQPVARTPYMRLSGDARARTRSQTQPPTQVQPPIHVQPPHNFGPTSFILFAPASTIPATPTPPVEPITLVPDTPIEDTTPPPREPRTRKPKTWNNWQLAAREKLRAGGPGSLLMMEFKSLVNPSVWNWLWEDKESVVSYVDEDEEVSVYCPDGKVFAADDAVGTLSLNRKLRRGFLRGHTPHLVANIGAFKELHYAVVDTGSQVNILPERLTNQLNLPMEAGSPISLSNASGTAISVIGVCRDVAVSTVGLRILQPLLVT